jgi:CRISPR-associated endonuclease/helicase Cas3
MPARSKPAQPGLTMAPEPNKNPLRHIAHARKRDDESWAEPHLLLDHLQDVAQLAEGFAATFGNGDWGFLAGLWHDLGKYKADFQAYIRRATDFENDQTDEGGPGKVDHTTAGAIHALEKLGPRGRILAYLIAGHHSGLPDWTKAEAPGRSLAERLDDVRHYSESIEGGAPEDILTGRNLSSAPCASRGLSDEAAHLWVRMLFSCLVDADFLDTEAYMDPEKARSRDKPSHFSLPALKDRFDAYMTQKRLTAPETDINAHRQQILQHCREGAALAPGLFSLTVPTGGGKTLASLGFALEHALLHNKRRVIIAIPYTSIIEQTADVLREVFGDDAVLEHHSNLDPDRETQKSKLATENWDAPIVVTTNVQLFESLFASRTSANRKLHNLVDSVLILDEAQMLPPEFLKPILSALRSLTAYFGVSAVLCTATQPALEGRIGGAAQPDGKGGFEGLTGVRELMPDPIALAGHFRRIKVTVRDLDHPTEWAELASEIALLERVLCVVNTRRDCRELHALLPDDTIHLSALMCGEHRSRVIQEIKAKLKVGAPTRVVSTQLVEAGVDLDFPIVYRALAGLDSIAQAAGRCNREGRLPNGELGRVIAFAPPKPAPRGLLLQGEYAARELFRTNRDLAASLSPEAFRSYFQKFYGRIDDFDVKGTLPLLTTDARKFQFQFRTVAQRFHLIDDQAQRSVIVWYESKTFSSRELIEELKRRGPTRRAMRKLQRCAVNIPEPAFLSLASQGAIEEITAPEGPLQLWAQAVPSLYDNTFGLRIEGPSYQGDEFIC